MGREHRTDEEIAEALQEQYRQEFLQRQARRNNNNNSNSYNNNNRDIGGRNNSTTTSRSTSAARQLNASRASAPPEHEVKPSPQLRSAIQIHIV